MNQWRKLVFTVADRLHMTAGQLLDVASSREIAEWAAYLALLSEEEAQAQDPGQRRWDPEALMRGL